MSNILNLPINDKQAPVPESGEAAPDREELIVLFSASRTCMPVGERPVFTCIGWAQRP